MYALQQQIGGNHQILGTDIDHGSIISDTLHGGWLVQGEIPAEAVDQTKFTQGSDFGALLAHNAMF